MRSSSHSRFRTGIARVYAEPHPWDETTVVRGSASSLTMRRQCRVARSEAWRRPWSSGTRHPLRRLRVCHPTRTHVFIHPDKPRDPPKATPWKASGSLKFILRTGLGKSGPPNNQWPHLPPWLAASGGEHSNARDSRNGNAEGAEGAEFGRNGCLCTANHSSLRVVREFYTTSSLRRCVLVLRMARRPGRVRRAWAVSW